MKKITKKTKLGDLIKANPDSAEILFSAGMFCVGCPAAIEETVEQGCLAHGMDVKQINKLIEKLNKKGGLNKK